MYKFIKSLPLFLLLFFAARTQAQITLTKATHNAQISESDTFRLAETKGFAIPQGGANIVYDYSSLKDSSTTDDIIRDYQSSASEPLFGSISHRFANYFGPFAGYPQKASHYEKIEDNARSEVGFRIAERHSFKIEGVPSPFGTAKDSMVYEKQEVIYGADRPIIAFPATYQSSWGFTTDRVRRTFKLNVPNFGYSNAPGLAIAYESGRDTVIGWGKLKVPGKTAANEYDVLLIRSDFTSRDSVYLNGTPGPGQLVDGFFGKGQGVSSTLTTYYFYRENVSTPVLKIALNAAGKLENVWYNSADAQPKSVAGINDAADLENAAIYPNPVSDALKFSFNLKNAQFGMTKVFNAMGQTVLEESAQFNLGKNETQTKVDSLPAGIYIFQLTGSNGQPLYSAKFIRQ